MVRAKPWYRVLGTEPEAAVPQRFCTGLHCPDCDRHYQAPTPNLLSFNSPFGACEICRGFGRTIGIDYSLVIPNDTRTLADGAIKPWQTAVAGRVILGKRIRICSIHASPN